MPSVKQEFRLPNGSTLELYYIGALANALGRTPATIRKWEIAGIIPDPCFKDSTGKRLYSQEQIDAIVMSAEKSKIKQGYSLSNTQFSARCHRELEKIKNKYKGE